MKTNIASGLAPITGNRSFVTELFQSQYPSSNLDLQSKAIFWQPEVFGCQNLVERGLLGLKREDDLQRGKGRSRGPILKGRFG